MRVSGQKHREPQNEIWLTKDGGEGKRSKPRFSQTEKKDSSPRDKDERRKGKKK